MMKNNATPTLVILGFSAVALSFALAPAIGSDDKMDDIPARERRVLHEYEVRGEDGVRLSSLSVVQWPDREHPHRTPLLYVIRDYEPNHDPDEEAVLQVRHPVVISIPGSAFGGEDWGQERTIAAIHWCEQAEILWLVAGTTTAPVSLLEIDQIRATFDPATKKWMLSDEPIATFYIHINQKRRELDRVTGIRLACPQVDEEDEVLLNLLIDRADKDSETIKVPVTSRSVSITVTTSDIESSNGPGKQEDRAMPE